MEVIYLVLSCLVELQLFKDVILESPGTNCNEMKCVAYS